MRTETALHVQAVLDRYPIEAPTVEGRDEVGIMNDNWLVTESSGSRYMLHAYQRVRDSGRIAFQLALQEHLHAAGFPTAPIVPTRSGEPFAVVEGVHWTLSGFVEGTEYDFASRAQATEAGRRLAQFETLAAGYRGRVVEPSTAPVNDGKWLAPVSSHVWRSSMLSGEHEARLRELYAGRGLDDELRYFGEWRRGTAIEWPRQRLEGLPQAWLHCDYHGRNMVFQDDELTGLFDFDFVAHGPRTFDLARGVFNFGREQRVSATLREDFCRAFLQGFESELPLTDEERHALPMMAVLNWAPDAAFALAREREPGDRGPDFHLRFGVGMMRAIDAEMRRLAPALGWPAS